MSAVKVRTLKHEVLIQTGGEAEFMFLASSPEVSASLAPAGIEIHREGAFLSARWLGLTPSFLARIASARDLALQLDSELAELSLRDAEPGTLLSSSLVFWRGKRLLLLGPALPRTALALALFRQNVDIEGDWICRLSPSGLTAVPRSIRWGANLGRSYPEIMVIAADTPTHRIYSSDDELQAWGPTTEDRSWICRDGRVDGIVVTDNLAGGCSLARSLTADMVWGNLMSARLSSDGGLPAIMALKGLAMAAPALRLSVGDLAMATGFVMQFLSTLDP